MNLFWYQEQLEREVEVEKPVQHEDEIDYVKSIEKQTVWVKVGCFNLDHVTAAKVGEEGIEVYLQLPFDQMLPNPNKPKKKVINGKSQVIGFANDIFTMPMGVNLTHEGDIKRFKELTNYDNV